MAHYNHFYRCFQKYRHIGFLSGNTTILWKYLVHLPSFTPVFVRSTLVSGMSSPPPPSGNLVEFSKVDWFGVKSIISPAPNINSSWNLFLGKLLSLFHQFIPTHTSNCLIQHPDPGTPRHVVNEAACALHLEDKPNWWEPRTPSPNPQLVYQSLDELDGGL